MFGEKEIIGSTIQKIKNNKLILPNFTYAEANDKLLIFKTPMYYFVYRLELFNQKIEELDQKIRDCNDSNKRQELRRMKRTLYMLIKSLVVCDSENKISLSSIPINSGAIVELIGEKKKLIIKLSD